MSQTRRCTLGNATRDLIVLYLILLGIAYLLAACAPLENAQQQVASKLFVTKYDPETGEPYLTEEPTELGAAVKDGLTLVEWIAFGTGGGGLLWGALKALALWKRSPEGKYLPAKKAPPEPPGPPSPPSSAGAATVGAQSA